MGCCQSSETPIETKWRHDIENKSDSYDKLYGNLKKELREQIAAKYGYNYILFLLDMYKKYIVRIGIHTKHKYIYIQQIDTHGYSTICGFWVFGIGIKGLIPKRDKNGHVIDMSKEYINFVKNKVPFPGGENKGLNAKLPLLSSDIKWFGIPVDNKLLMLKTNMSDLSTPSVLNSQLKNKNLMKKYPFKNGLTESQLRQMVKGINNPNHIYDTIEQPKSLKGII